MFINSTKILFYYAFLFIDYGLIVFILWNGLNELSSNNGGVPWISHLLQQMNLVFGYVTDNKESVLKSTAFYQFLSVRGMEAKY